MFRTLLAIALSLSCGTLSASQPTVYPVLEEPYHRPVFRNDKITVYDVRIEPGHATAFHRHERDQLAITLRSGTVATQFLGGVEQVSQGAPGVIAFIPYSVLGAYTHRVRPVAGSFRVVGIEFSRASPAGTTRALAGPGQNALPFPQGTITRVAIAPGASRPIEGSLVVAAAPGELRISDGTTWSFGEGALRWIEVDPSKIYRNDSRANVSILVVDLNY